MKAAVVVTPGELAVLDVPVPVPSEYQALARNVAGGICGTDRKIVRGTFFRKTYPGILGHESAGRIAQCGARVRHLAEGDLVLRTAAVYPGSTLGGFSSLLGGFSEYGLVTDWQAALEDGVLVDPPWYYRLQMVLPPAFDPVDAGAFIVLKETLSWARRLGIGPGSSVVVLGLGSVGLSFVRVSRLLGATCVIAVGRRDEHLNLARQFGANHAIHTEREQIAAQVRAITDGQGAQFVIEVTGDRELLEQAAGYLANGGRIGVYALSDNPEATLNWSWSGPAPRNWSVHFHDPDEQGVHQEALDIVASGAFDLKATLTHTLPLVEINEAFRLIGAREALKAALIL